MGNIAITNESGKKINVLNSSTKSFIVSTPPMSFNVDVVNGVWNFTLQNPNIAIQNYINAEKFIRVQLVRYSVSKRASVSSVSRTNLPGSIKNTDPSFKLKPNYPSYIKSNSYNDASKIISSINVNSFKSSNLQNMDLSTWANSMIRYAGTSSFILNKSGVVQNYTNFGHYFIDYAFAIMIDNQILVTSNIFRAKYHYVTPGSPQINTNYTLSNNSLDIFEI